jgi:hypothetical protein
MAYEGPIFSGPSIVSVSVVHVSTMLVLVFEDEWTL